MKYNDDHLAKESLEQDYDAPASGGMWIGVGVTVVFLAAVVGLIMALVH